MITLFAQRASIATLPVLTGLTLLGLSIAGCKSDSITDPPGVTVTIPKVGSSFTVQTFGRDRSGAKVAGTEDTVTATVTATDGSFYGRQNVVIVSPPSGGDDFMLIHEPNGDVSVISAHSNGSTDFQFTMPQQWIRLPFGSKQGGLLRSYDTTATSGSLSGGLTHRTSVGYLGSEELTLGGEKLATHKVRVTTNWTATHGSSSETVEVKETFWFAPKIGFFLKIEGERNSNRNPSYAAWSVELINYTLK